MFTFPIFPDPSQSPANLYPNMAWALNDPELGPILQNAAQQGLTAAELQAALFPTNFWQGLADPARQYKILEGTDPRTLTQDIQFTADRITALANQLGINVPVDAIYAMAKNALYHGMDEGQIRRMLATHMSIEFHGASPVIASIKQAAANYMIPLAEATIHEWGRQLASGYETMDNINGRLLEQAKALYPGIADRLDQGMTPGQLFEPYKQIAAQELGVNPEAIDPLDPKWSRALNMQTGDFMNFYDWTRTIRTDPIYGWDKTEGARQQASQLVTAFGEKFGMM